MNTEPPTSTLTFTLSETAKAALEAIAKQEDRSVSSIMRQIIRAELERQGQNEEDGE